MCLGIPGRVLEIQERDALKWGMVEFGGISKEVCLAYLPETVVGDYVLVHVGFAVSRVEEHEATEIFDYIQQIGELDAWGGSDALPEPDPDQVAPDGEEASR